MILVTLDPFGKVSEEPLNTLKNYFKGKESILIYGHKPKKDELISLLTTDEKVTAILSGTEIYDQDVLEVAHDLKIISRAGIGVDNVDLEYCAKKGITVTNTPDAPSAAVAELTICQMLNMLRKVQNVNLNSNTKWNRYIGRELGDCIIGVIGLGRIGGRVLEILKGFHPKRISVNDINTTLMVNHENLSYGVIATSKENILKECDIITIHIPLKDDSINNVDYITLDDLNKMKSNVRLLNMSRGGIINEEDLYEWLKIHPKATTAVDSFKNEKYEGKLLECRNAYLTPHLGSCTVSSRIAMEMGAVKNIINYFEAK